ncbi:hypothetical protein LO771_21180 [Streptacidiphilus sp. ASG 303]|uniref:hypothetical protein n=1 Tax=Streptacidiphilus sp. ASG 303 TaxID=2896847 RepID=UPI001E46EEF0|nr:hypothetical protein [Streptacidiphilus sp. ASG 303]MCD0484836.1 hypothetical protein [Streptacidiphilus sp. ASG 303]
MHKRLPPTAPPTASPAPRGPAGPRARRRPGLRALSGGVVLAAGMTLAACGSGGGGDAGRGVDTLVSGSAAPDKGTASQGAAPGPAVDARRPQERLDSTDEEKNKLDDAYWACLQAHGVPMMYRRVTSGQQAPPTQDKAEIAKHRAGFDACRDKQPLPPPELEPQTNPHYADDFHAYVKCLRHRGVKVHIVPDTSANPDGLSWTFDSGNDPGIPESERDKADRACTLEAFGGK